MVRACANPSCLRRFLYLHEGKLFVFRPLVRKDQRGFEGHFQHPCLLEDTQWYWLCNECAEHMTLICNENHDVAVVRKDVIEQPRVEVKLGESAEQSSRDQKAA